jgi:hypothetical protein
LIATYADALPISRNRPGYPEDVRIAFADQPLDTSRAGIGVPAKPARFRIVTVESGLQLDFRYRDVDGDLSVGAAGEFIEVMTPEAEGSTRWQPVWRLNVVNPAPGTTIAAPGAGDEYLLAVNKPFGPADVLTFTATGEFVDEARAATQFDDEKPYVVPNPYVASAEFEPERFAVSGRGVRRLEFRAIPALATIRIYTVRGELVQMLRHDGSSTGMVEWNLRSKDNLEVAPGLYIFHVDSELGEFVGKLAIIK